VVTGAMWSNVFGSHKKNSASVVALDWNVLTLHLIYGSGYIYVGVPSFYHIQSVGKLL
jgi:hypothetical protein